MLLLDARADLEPISGQPRAAGLPRADGARRQLCAAVPLACDEPTLGCGPSCSMAMRRAPLTHGATAQPLLRAAAACITLG